MNLSDIHFHDGKLRRVIEFPESDELHFEVDYPIDWENNRFEPRVIVFCDVLNYCIDEIPFHGAPTILDAVDKGAVGHRCHVVLETSAGTRTFLFSTVDLHLQMPTSGKPGPPR